MIPSNLPSKFEPFILGNPKCKAPVSVKTAIDSVFTHPLVDMKGGYVFDAGNWVLKFTRNDGLMTTPDTHLYRVRKAEKVRKYIADNRLDRELVVPQKYLYWKVDEGRFYVVSQKVDLAPEVANPTPELGEAIRAAELLASGQMQALVSGAATRALSPLQAKALAELATMGLTDLSYNNLFFDRQGRIAVIDTEPVKRALKKKLFAYPSFGFWMGDKAVNKAQQVLTGTAKLKLSCSDPLARREVEKVERRHTLWNLAKVVTKLALVCLAIYFLPTIIASLALPSALATTLKICAIGAASLKALLLSLNTVSLGYIWKQSCKGIHGIQAISMAEAVNAC